MFNVAESILIVEASDTGKFSKRLYNLIGTKNDSENETVGPVDGSIDATMFNENQFAQTPLTSSQKVIFIGCPKGTNDYIEAIRFENHNAVDEDGVYIGVSGKHACITVNTEPPSKEGYWEFLDRAKAHGQEFEDLLASLRPGQKEVPAEPEADDNPVFGFARMVGSKAVSVGARIKEDVAMRQKASEIREQRYQYAVKRFYDEMLRDFAEA